MPLYEYQCDKCHHRFEIIQNFSARPVRKCPKCGRNGVRKLLSSPAVHFKGSGWYVTDYARKGGAAAGGDAGGEGKDKDSGTGKDASRDSDAGKGNDAGKAASGDTAAGKETSGKSGGGGPAKKGPRKD